MASRLDHERLELLLRRLGEDDREVAARLEVDPSTAWRLRNRKIAKINKYIVAATLALGEELPQVVDPALAELLAQAQSSPRLRALLLSLRDILQEAAMPGSS